MFKPMTGLRSLRGALAILLVLMVAHAEAEIVIGVSRTNAEKAASLIKPGAVLIWMCSTCTGIEVIIPRRVQMVPYGNSPHTAVVLNRDVIAHSKRGALVDLDAVQCSNPVNPSEYEVISSTGERVDDEWSVDLTYTFVRGKTNNEFINIGSLVGVDNYRLPSFSLSRLAQKRIEECRTLHDIRVRQLRRDAAKKNNPLQTPLKNPAAR